MSDNNKKSQKKKLLALLLASGAWAGVITGIVLRHGVENNNEFYYYDYTKEGDLIIRGKTSNKDHFSKKVIAVFVDENKNIHEIDGYINANGVFVTDTSKLPIPGKYKLDKVIEKDNKNNVVFSNDELNDKQKIDVYRPGKVDVINNKKGDRQLVVKLNEELTNKEISAIFKDSKGNKHKITALVDKDGNVTYDTSKLPTGDTYTLDAILDETKFPPRKVFNVDLLDDNTKKVDRTRDYNVSGDAIVHVKLPETNKPNKNLVGIFVDQNGKEHEIDGTINPDGSISFDTKDLPTNNKYNLDRIVDANNKNNVIVKNNELLNEQKEPIVKPREVNIIYNKDNDHGNNEVKVGLDKTLDKQTVTAVFVDSNNKEYKIDGTVDTNGNVIFDTSHLPTNEIYELDRIIKKESDPEKKVANLDDIKRKDKTVNKLNTNELNVPSKYDDQGNLILKAKVDKQLYANDQVVAIFVDQDGNKHKVIGDVDSQGNVEFNTKTLDNNKVYTFEKVVTLNEPIIEVIKNDELAPNQKLPIHKPNAEVTKEANGDYTLTLKDKNLFDAPISVIFVDEQNNPFKLDGWVDKNGNVTFDTKNNDLLPKDHTYKLDKVLDQVGQPVVNVNDLNPFDRLLEKVNIDKLKEDKVITYDQDGNPQINVNRDPNNKVTLDPNKEYEAVFVDQNGKEHKVNVTVDPNTHEVSVDTSNLPSPGKYNLDRIVDKTNNNVVINNSKLQPEEKVTIIKPSVDININKDKNVEINFKDKNLINEPLKIKVIDENNKEYIVDATANVDALGNAVFNTGDDNILPPNHKYTIVGILNKNNEPVANLNNIDDNKKVINKKNNGRIKDDNTIEFDVPVSEANKDVIVKVKDKEGNIFEIPATITDDGKVTINPTNPPLEKDKIYDFDSIVIKNPDEVPAKVLVTKDDLNDEVKEFNNSIDQARKISFESPKIVGISNSDSTLLIPVVDKNKLADDKELVITLVDKNNPEIKIKRIVEVNKETNTLEVPFANLDENTTYVFESIKFKDDSLNVDGNETKLEKTTKIAIDDSKLKNFEFTTNKTPALVLDDFKITESSNDRVRLELDVLNPNNANELPKTLLVNYNEVDENNNPIQPPKQAIATFDPNTNKYVVDIANLKPNTKYVIDSIVDTSKQPNVTLNYDESTDKKLEFGTQPTTSTVSFNKDDKDNYYDSDGARIVVDFNDPDQKIKPNQPVILTFKDKTTNEVKTAEGFIKQIPNANNPGKFEFDIGGLSPDTNYELIGVVVPTKDDDAFVNPIFSNFEAPNNEFTTLSTHTTAIRFNSPNPVDGDVKTFNVDVELKFGNDRLALNNKAAQLVYVSNAGEEIRSEPIILDTSTRELNHKTFVFNKNSLNDPQSLSNFINNREYKLSKLIVADASNLANKNDSVKLNELLKQSDQTIQHANAHTFAIAASKAISVGLNTPEIPVIKDNTTNKISIPLNYNDSIIKPDITSNADGSQTQHNNGDGNNLSIDLIDPDTKQKITINNPKVVVDANGNKKLVLDAPNLDPNKAYVVDKINQNIKPLPRENINETKFRIPLNDLDNALTADTLLRNDGTYEDLDQDDQNKDANKVNVVINKKDDNSVANIKDKKIVIDENGNKYLEFTADVELNQPYDINLIEFNKKPNNAKFDINPQDSDNKIFDSSKENTDPIEFSNDLSVTNVSVTNSNGSQPNNTINVELNDENNKVKILFDLNKSDGMIKDKFVKVKYHDNNGNEVWSDPIKVVDNQNNYSVNFPKSTTKLIPNREYTLDGIYFFNSEDDAAEPVQKISGNQTSTIITEPSETKVKNYNVEDETSRQATIEFAINSKDEVFENDQVILVDVIKENDPNTKLTLKGKLQKVGNEWKVIARFGDENNPNVLLDTAAVYEINEIRFETKPSKAKVGLNGSDNNIIYDSKSKERLKKITTLAASYEIQPKTDEDTGIISADVVDQDQTTNQVIVNIYNNGSTLFNKKLQLVYFDGFKEVRSNVIDGFLYDERLYLPYTFEFANLEGNKTYTFRRLVYGNDENSLNITFPNPHNTTDTFIVAPKTKIQVESDTKVIELPKTSTSVSDIKIQVTDTDNVFKPTDTFKVTLQKPDGSSLVVENATFGIDDSTQPAKKYINVHLDPSELNTNYKVTEIEFIPPANNPPPFKVGQDTNNDGTADNNIIYSVNDNDAANLVFNSSLFAKNPLSSNPTNENPTQTGLSVDLVKDSGLINNKYIRAKYVSNDGIVNWTEAAVVEDGTLNFDKTTTNKTYNLQLLGLTPNRNYTFDGLYYFDTNAQPNDGDATLANKISFQDDITPRNIVTKPSNTSVLNITYTDYNDTEATINFDVDSRDNVFEANQEVEVVLVNVNNENQTINIDANLIHDNSSVVHPWKVNARTTSLKANTTYKVKEIKFKNKPPKANTNLNGDANNVIYTSNASTPTFSTSLATILETLSSRTNVLIPTNEQAQTSFDVSAQIRKNSTRLNNKWVKLIYSSSNGEDVVSNAQQLTDEGLNNETFTFSNLEHNRLYTFKELRFGDDAGFDIANAEIIQTVEDLTHSFEIKARQVSTSLSNDNNDKTILWNAASLKFNFTDPNNELENNQTVSIKYKRTTDNEWSTANGTVDLVNNKINFNLENLFPSSTYQFGDITTTTKKDGAYDVVTFSANTDTFNTLDPVFNVVSINSTSEIDTTNQTVIIKISKQGININGNSLRLVYSVNDGDNDDTNNPLVYSNIAPVQTSNNPHTEIQETYTFNFDNLIRNRNYTFKKLVYGSSIHLNDVNKINNNTDGVVNFTTVNNFDTNPQNIKSFAILPTPITATFGSQITRSLTNNQNTMIRVRYNLDDVDNVLDANTSINVKLVDGILDTPINLNNVLVKIDATANNQKYFEIDLEPLKVNQNYRIQEIKLANKPATAHFDFVNKDNRNDQDNKLKLELTSSENNTVKNNLELASVNNTVNNDNNTVSTRVLLNATNGLLTNKKLKIKWSVETETELSKKYVWSEVANGSDVADNQLTFTTNNLRKNRKYILEGIYYADNSENDVTEDPLKKLTPNASVTHGEDKNFVTTPGETAVIRFDWVKYQNQITSATAKIDIIVRTQDEFFENNQKFIAVFEKVVDSPNGGTTTRTELAPFEGTLEFDNRLQEWVVHVELTGLDSESNYEFKKLSFKPENNKIKPDLTNSYVNGNSENLIFDSSNNPNDSIPNFTDATRFRTSSSYNELVSIENPTNDALVQLSNNQTTIRAKINTDATSLRNKGLRLIYSYINDQGQKSEVKSNIVAFVANQADEGVRKDYEFEFTFSNLEHNRKYLIAQIVYTDSPQSESNPHNFLNPNYEGRFHSFRTNRTAAIAINSSDALITTKPRTATNSAPLELKLSDPDNVLIANDQVNLKFKKKDDSGNEISVVGRIELRDGANGQKEKVVVFDATPIDLNTEYKITEISIPPRNPSRAGDGLGKTNTDTNNVIYDANDTTTTPLVFENKVKANNITATQPNKNETRTNVSLELERSNALINGKFVRLKYTDNNNNVLWSDPIQVNDSNANSLSLSLPQTGTDLIPNRQYTLEGVYFFDNENDTTNPTPIKVDDNQKTNANIITPPSDSTISVQSDFAVIDEEEANVKLVFNSNDQPFTDANIVPFDNIPVNGSIIATAKISQVGNDGSLSNEQTFTVFLKKENDKWVFTGKATNLSPSTKYQITEISLGTNKPAPLHTNLNNSSTNTIRPANGQKIEFTTLQETELATLSSTDVVSNRSNHITATFNRYGTRLKDKHIKLIYSDNNGNTYETNAKPILEDTNSYDFTLPDPGTDKNNQNLLWGNRRYTFVKAVYSSENTVGANNRKDLKSATGLSDTFITDPTTITISSVNWSNPVYKENTNRYTTISTVEFNDIDQSLKENDVVVARIGKYIENKEGDTTTVTITNLFDVNLTVVNDNGVLKLRSQEIPNLDFNTKYKLVSLTKNTHTAPDIANPVFSTHLPVNLVTIPPTEYKVTAIARGDNQTSDLPSGTTSTTIKLTINRRGSDLDNKYIKVVYRDQNNELYSSTAAQFNANGREVSQHTFVLNNLKGNRQYTIQKIVYADNNSFDAQTTGTILKRNPVDLAHSFKILPTDISASYVSASNNTLQTNNDSGITLRYNISDTDLVILPTTEPLNPSSRTDNAIIADKATVTISSINAPEHNITINDVVIQRDPNSNQKYIDIVVNNQLKVNTEYVVTSIWLTERPTNAFYEYAQDRNKADNNKKLFILDNTNKADQRNKFANKIAINTYEISPSTPNLGVNVLSFDATINFANEPTSLLNNKYVVLKYQELGKNEQETNHTITSTPTLVNNGSVRVNVNGLTPNRKYKLIGVYYGSDQSISQNTSQDEEHSIEFNGKDANKDVITAPSSTNTSNHTITTRTRSANITVNVNSNDNVFTTTPPQTLVATISKQDGSRSQTVETTLIQDQNNWKATFEFLNLDSSTNYKVDSIKFKEQPIKAYANLNRNSDNAIFTHTSNVNNQITFRTQDANTKLNLLEYDDVSSDNYNSIKVDVTANISTDGNTLTNKYIALVYRNKFDNSKKIVSNAMQFNIDDGEAPFKFRFDKKHAKDFVNLFNNRTYEFEKLVYANSEDEINSNLTNTINRADNFERSKLEFSTKPRVTTVSNLSVQQRGNDPRYIKLRVQINDIDNVLEDGTNKATVQIAYNDASNSSLPNILGNIITINGNKYLEFETNNLDINQEYKIVNITINTKPTKAAVNVNTNGVIYDDATATNKLTTFKNELLIDSVSFNAPTLNANSNNLINGSITINLTRSANEIIANKFLRVKLTSNDGEVIVVNSTSTIGNNNAQTISLANLLKPNRSYTLGEISYVDNATANTQTNITKKSNFVIPRIETVVSKTTLSTFASSNITYKSATLKIKIDSNDDGFVKDNKFNISIAKVTDPNTLISIDENNISFVHENDGWYIVANVSGLTSDTEYKLINLTNIDEPPIKTRVKYNNDGVIYSSNTAGAEEYKFRTVIHKNKVKKIIPTKETFNLNNEDPTINVTINRQGAYLNNNWVKLIYSYDGRNYSSDAKQLPENNTNDQDQIISFTFSGVNKNNLPKNANAFTFVKLVYGVDQNINENTSNTFEEDFVVSNQDGTNKLIFKTSRSSANPVVVSSLHENQTRSNYKIANVVISLNDSDNVLKNGASVYYKFEGDSNYTKTTLNVNGSQKTFNAVAENNELNTDKYLLEVWVKPSRTTTDPIGHVWTGTNDSGNQNPVDHFKVYTKPNNNASLKVNNELKVTAVADAQSANTSWKPKLTLSGNDKIYTNSNIKFDIVVKTNNNQEHEKQRSLDTTYNNGFVEFKNSFGLIPNREYSIDIDSFKIKDATNTNGTKVPFAPNVNKNKVSAPSITRIYYTGNLTTNITTTTATINLKIKTDDEALINNQKFKVSIIPTHSNSPIIEKYRDGIEATLKNYNNTTKIGEFEINLANLSPNTEYRISSVSFYKEHDDKEQDDVTRPHPYKTNENLNILITGNSETSTNAADIKFETTKTNISWNIHSGDQPNTNTTIRTSKANGWFKIHYTDNDNGLVVGQIVNAWISKGNNGSEIRITGIVEANNLIKFTLSPDSNLEANTEYVIRRISTTTKKPEHFANYKFNNPSNSDKFATTKTNITWSLNSGNSSNTNKPIKVTKANGSFEISYTDADNGLVVSNPPQTVIATLVKKTGGTPITANGTVQTGNLIYFELPDNLDGNTEYIIQSITTSTKKPEHFENYEFETNPDPRVDNSATNKSIITIIESIKWGIDRTTRPTVRGVDKLVLDITDEDGGLKIGDEIYLSFYEGDRFISKPKFRLDANNTELSDNKIIKIKVTVGDILKPDTEYLIEPSVVNKRNDQYELNRFNPTPKSTNANKFRTLEDVPTITNFEFVVPEVENNQNQTVRLTFNKALESNKKVRLILSSSVNGESEITFDPTALTTTGNTTSFEIPRNLMKGNRTYSLVNLLIEDKTKAFSQTSKVPKEFNNIKTNKNFKTKPSRYTLKNKQIVNASFAQNTNGRWVSKTKVKLYFDDLDQIFVKQNAQNSISDNDLTKMRVSIGPKGVTNTTNSVDSTFSNSANVTRFLEIKNDSQGDFVEFTIEGLTFNLEYRIFKIEIVQKGNSQGKPYDVNNNDINDWSIVYNDPDNNRPSTDPDINKYIIKNDLEVNYNNSGSDFVVPTLNENTNQISGATINLTINRNNYLLNAATTAKPQANGVYTKTFVALKYLDNNGEEAWSEPVELNQLTSNGSERHKYSFRFNNLKTNRRYLFEGMFLLYDDKTLFRELEANENVSYGEIDVSEKGRLNFTTVPSKTRILNPTINPTDQNYSSGTELSFYLSTNDFIFDQNEQKLVLTFEATNLGSTTHIFTKEIDIPVESNSLNTVRINLSGNNKLTGLVPGGTYRLKEAKFKNKPFLIYNNVNYTQNNPNNSQIIYDLSNTYGSTPIEFSVRDVNELISIKNSQNGWVDLPAGSTRTPIYLTINKKLENIGKKFRIKFTNNAGEVLYTNEATFEQKNDYVLNLSKDLNDNVWAGNRELIYNSIEIYNNNQWTTMTLEDKDNSRKRFFIDFIRVTFSRINFEVPYNPNKLYLRYRIIDPDNILKGANQFSANITGVKFLENDTYYELDPLTFAETRKSKSLRKWVVAENRIRANVTVSGDIMTIIIPNNTNDNTTHFPVVSSNLSEEDKKDVKWINNIDAVEDSDREDSVIYDSNNKRYIGDNSHYFLNSNKSIFTYYVYDLDVSSNKFSRKDIFKFDFNNTNQRMDKILEGTSNSEDYKFIVVKNKNPLTISGASATIYDEQGNNINNNSNVIRNYKNFDYRLSFENSSASEVGKHLRARFIKNGNRNNASVVWSDPIQVNDTNLSEARFRIPGNNGVLEQDTRYDFEGLYAFNSTSLDTSSYNSHNGKLIEIKDGVRFPSVYSPLGVGVQRMTQDEKIRSRSYDLKLKITPNISGYNLRDKFSEHDQVYIEYGKKYHNESVFRTGAINLRNEGNDWYIVTRITGLVTDTDYEIKKIGFYSKPVRLRDSLLGENNVIFTKPNNDINPLSFTTRRQDVKITESQSKMTLAFRNGFVGIRPPAQHRLRIQTPDGQKNIFERGHKYKVILSSWKFPFEKRNYFENREGAVDTNYDILKEYVELTLTSENGYDLFINDIYFFPNQHYNIISITDITDSSIGDLDVYKENAFKTQTVADWRLKKWGTATDTGRHYSRAEDIAISLKGYGLTYNNREPGNIFGNAKGYGLKFGARIVRNRSGLKELYTPIGADLNNIPQDPSKLWSIKNDKGYPYGEVLVAQPSGNGQSRQESVRWILNDNDKNQLELDKIWYEPWFDEWYTAPEHNGRFDRTWRLIVQYKNNEDIYSSYGEPKYTMFPSYFDSNAYYWVKSGDRNIKHPSPKDTKTFADGKWWDGNDLMDR